MTMEAELLRAHLQGNAKNELVYLADLVRFTLKNLSV